MCCRKVRHAGAECLCAVLCAALHVVPLWRGHAILDLLNPAVLAVYLASALLIVFFTNAVSLTERVQLKDAAFGALVAAFPNTGLMGVPCCCTAAGAGPGPGGAGAPISGFQIMVIALGAALPGASNVSLLAERCGADNGRIARIIMTSTVLAFVSFPTAAWLFGVQAVG